MTFDDFVKQEHAKRVAHFVDYINAHNHKATIQECMQVFGFCEQDARPVYSDAWAAVVQQGEPANPDNVGYPGETDDWWKHVDYAMVHSDNPPF